ncbi:hypothetical protein F5Y11DRAFT_366696 [Daldinia sp. FL1419]|nr:hypothetical protein F5Y11DRAFT_366696 [Daldinia sp. FL1419]
MTVRDKLQAQYIIHQQPPLTYLSLTDCIETFGSGSSETCGDVILVYQNETNNSSVARLKEPVISSDSYIPHIFNVPWHWMCGYSSECDAQTILNNSTWIIYGHPVSLFTIGDMVASFLQEPDVIVPNSQSCYVSRQKRVMAEIGVPFWASTLLGLIGLSSAWWFFIFTFRETSAAYADSKTDFTFATMLQLGFGNMPTLWTKKLRDKLLGYGGAENPTLSYITGASLASLPQLALSAFHLVFNNFIISSSCHPPGDVQNVQLHEVRWGVTRKNLDDSIEFSFSLPPVRPPGIGEPLRNSL